ncbi:RNA polymerase sigma-70 factor (ECF subfamily) [Pontibacter ummariensis]|uniref:RNA polymerase sigma-70 factor, ECF subfamily n=1 Tax=Pontibacter ummariensis TaxID=1610492 RepID=A0A239BT94_9BACT|nr:sigma-70 family RNA polymerase sigma factor [Pontibacter ummariensis]PRY15645.1 RNA polymerase sigma-70 factor (ECF subfamily) [Pontibacter ummariensis]SNS10872.1 RNA polymerase sigma-70 factor, ECF subfamily [Pontibacter ummariensis]
MTEAELIAGCQKADSKAQKHLYERFASQMYGVCLRYLKNEMDAEEALLNGFMKIYQYIDRFEAKGSFEGWVRRIMVNEALAFLRKKEPLHLAIEDSSVQIAGLGGADQDLAEEELLELLRTLPAGYRAVFNLYAIEGYSHKEIADMLGITEGTSKSQLSKARAMLQRRLTGLEAIAS